MKVERRIKLLQSALATARARLITFGGDPRTVIAESGSSFGDEMQADVLDQIDAALSVGGEK